VITAIRAVAFILKRHSACEIADVAAKQLIDNLTPHLVNNVIAAIAPQVARILTTSESLTSTVEQADKLYHSIKAERDENDESTLIAAVRLEEATNDLYTSVEDCHNAMKLLTPSLDATQDRINHLSKQMLSSSPPMQQTPHPSYSSVAAAFLPPTIDQAVGRAAIRARQILLDPKPGENLFPPNSSKTDIATKLKEALSNIRDELTPPGDIKAISTLHNGGIIVELENELLASWLRGPIGGPSLESQFDTAVSFRKRTYPIVIEYLHIQMQIEQDGFLRNIERENHLPEHSLATIRWIKPPLRRQQDQRKAFALLHVTEADIANNILRDGICIDNERFGIHKDMKEPIRCAKCQRYGHIARNCRSTSDVCGTCTENHRTSHCNAFRTTRCVNCRSNNHTSWNRKCPEFLRRTEIINDKFPENKMPYFPTEAAWTHVSQPPRPPRTATPPPASQPTSSRPPQKGRNPNPRQSTLNFDQPPPAPSSRARSPQQPQSSPLVPDVPNVTNTISQPAQPTNQNPTTPSDRTSPSPSNV